MVQVFREVRRVLKDDGVLWLNLGDSYAAGGQNSGSRPEDLTAKQRSNAGCRYEARKAPVGLKPKDLVGIPWRVAFALQADGWYLRSDVIWSKDNPMPESVRDRPTKSHEYVFLLTKNERYFWDADAVREPYQDVNHPVGADGKFLNPRSAGGVSSKDWVPPVGSRFKTTALSREYNPAGRNIRSVWSIATQPYAGAHFATMPEALVRRCVLAGSRPGDFVLDPFLGSGTVARVAISFGRRAVGCDLNRAYLELARERMQVTRGLPLEMEASA